MPYSVEWDDTSPRILTVSVADPLTDDEITGLRDHLKPLAEDDASVYVLADLTHFDITTSFQRLLAATDGIPIPALTSHTAHSRLAIVGGGSALTLIFALMRQITDETEFVKVFETPDAARVWLREQQTAH